MKLITRQHIILITLIIPVVSKGQHTTERTNMLWAGYYNTIRFNNKWAVVSDAQVRTKDWSEKWSQILVRSGLTFSFNSHFALTGGIAFFKNAQYADKRLLLKNEWRPWQEFSYQYKISRTNFNQRLRTEQRFLQQVENGNKINHYEYIFRLRYRFDLLFPLNQEALKLLVANEVLVNPRYISNNRFFDQNRTFAGINYKISPVTTFQFQYLKIFQWSSSTKVLNNENVFRVNVQQQFSFKRNNNGK